MNANKKNFKILVILILVLLPCVVSAATVTSGNKASAGQTFARRKYINSKLVFCTQFDKNAPTSCDNTDELTKRVNAGVGQIIKWYDGSDKKYICAEMLITKFMYNYKSTSGRSNYSLESNGQNWVSACGESSVKTAYNNAVAAYNNVNALNNNVITYKKSGSQVTKLDFSASGNDYVAKVNVRTPDDKYAIECSVNNDGKVEVGKEDGKNYYTATVTVNKSKSGKTITLTCKPKYTFKSPKTFYTDCNGQMVITSELENDTKNGNNQSISGKFTAPGNIQITKKNSKTQAVMSGVQFSLYTNSSCTTRKTYGTTGTNGKVTFLGLNPGTYYYKETSTPSGFVANTACSAVTVTSNNTTSKTVYNTPKDVPNDDGILKIYKKNSTTKLSIYKPATFIIYKGAGCNSGVVGATIDTEGGQGQTSLEAGIYSVWEESPPEGYSEPTQKCVINSVTISAGNTTEKTVYNNTTCEAELKALGSSPTKTQLIELYKRYPEYTNLLNFTPNGASCSKNISCNNFNTSNCLSAASNISTSFESNNLSCYNEVEQIGTDTLYCLTKFSFTNNLNGKSNFTSKTGQPISDLANVKLDGFLTKTCYGVVDNNNSESISLKYSDYIGDITFDNNYLLETAAESDGNGNPIDIDTSVNLISSNLSKENNKQYKQYIKTIKINYSFPTIYVQNGSGERSEDFCESCKTIGNVYLSDFMYQEKSVRLPFVVKYNNDIFEDISNDSCTYTPNPELIDDNKLQLEFRTIDTSNPFPGVTGQNGKSRITGNNWCDKENNTCSGDPAKNSTIKNKIVNSNNSYNRKRESAKYVIILTPSTIKEIRNKNKEKKYDDYDFTCMNNGETCISNYLTSLCEEGVITTMTNEKRSNFETVCN